MDMTPYYDKDGITIYHGDARAVLKTLPAESVNCAVTSPPYWGLRDYGTATWKGGDSQCDHLKKPSRGIDRRSSTLDGGVATIGAQDDAKIGFRDICGKCGAIRIDVQIGLEATPDDFVQSLVSVLFDVRRVLCDDGTLWLNLGDSYAGSWGAQSRPNPGNQDSSTLEGGSMLSARQIAAHPHETHTGSLKNTPGLKAKDLCGIPWRVALALQADGWYLRSDIIWHKPNPMPESVTDRPTKAHEYIFLLSKSERYYYDQDAIAEPVTSTSGGACFGKVNQDGPSSRRVSEEDNDRIRGETKNKRTVWTVNPASYDGAHFAVFPPKLIEPCILAGCPQGGTVLDPFLGSGTTAAVAKALGCKCVGIELNESYIKLAMKRFKQRRLELSA